MESRSSARICSPHSGEPAKREIFAVESEFNYPRQWNEPSELAGWASIWNLCDVPPRVEIVNSGKEASRDERPIVEHLVAVTQSCGRLSTARSAGR